ncbi:hypothetical protein G6F22_020868 [Rhizopus arrhizus]|nr:hypothetical protein G6F22_020868 [Rhizopus arrhizus]KAG0922436.1 hypothetical protein G6F31_019914 [Rhizopus arrhizus]
MPTHSAGREAAGTFLTLLVGAVLTGAGFLLARLAGLRAEASPAARTVSGPGGERAAALLTLVLAGGDHWGPRAASGVLSFNHARSNAYIAAAGVSPNPATPSCKLAP